MHQTRVPQRSDYENVFSLFKEEGRRPVRKDLGHPFVAGTLIIPSNLSYFSGQGGFAIVYRLRDQSGQEWAIRCPLRLLNETDRSHAQALSSWNPPPTLRRHLVLPTFFKEAIFVGGEWIDITVMPWVVGETLDELLNGKSRTDWNTLADEWQQLIALLVAEGIAHGDLQPKNVIRATDTTLTLIDYDSFLIPGAEGALCAVGGLQGYGHPLFTSGRATRIYHRDMDTFAGLVVLLSLRALAVDPTLLREGAEDGFVIPAAELVTPGEVFKRLQRLPEPVSSLASKLIKLCADPGGGLDPWLYIPTSGYKPYYQLSLPPVPPAPVRVPFTPLFT